MNSSRLEQIFINDPCTAHMFAGFGNPDIILPKINYFPSFVILNTDSYLGKGEHWCVICFTENKYCYFFDSFGRPPTEYNFISTLRSMCSTIRHNSRAVQGTLAETCGHHCVYFCMKLCIGWSPDKIIKSYSFSTRKNDNMVFDFVRRKYGDIAAQIQ